MPTIKHSENQTVGLNADLHNLRVFDLDPVLPKDAGRGIKVDLINPTFAWCDLVFERSIAVTGKTMPTLAVFRGGNCRRLFFTAANQVDFDATIPHDHVPNSDLFLRLNWGHNGASISGNLVLTASVTYAKAFSQQIFPVEKVFTWTIPATNLMIAPRWGSITSEIQISSLAPTLTQLDSALIEPDGDLMVNLTVASIPVITGGSINQPYLSNLKGHYQSTGRGTKNKSPNFNN